MNVEMLDDILKVMFYPICSLYRYFSDTYLTLPNLIQCAYDKGRKFKIDMMHFKMLDISLLILIMCLVWSTYNKTEFIFYIHILYSIYFCVCLYL